MIYNKLQRSYVIKHITILLTAILLYQGLFGQTGKINLSGRLNNKKKLSVIHIRCMDATGIAVPVGANNTFSFTIDSLQNGLYTVDEIGTIYLSAGYKLNIQPVNEGGYLFAGSGALENNAIRTAQKELSKFIPVDKSGGLQQAALYLDVPVFLQKLDSFQHSGELLFNASKDTFFRKYAALDLQYYGKDLLFNYFALYGIDQKKQEKVQAMMDTLDRKAPNFAGRMLSLINSTRQKVMSIEDRKRLMKILYDDWGKDDEILFLNSYWYRKAIDGFLTAKSSSLKYLANVAKHLKQPEYRDINKLTAARGELHNPYILSYYEYTLTRAILMATKDTAVLHKYFQEYITKSPRQDYLSNVKEIYDNAVTYTDSMPAPQFSYVDISGKSVSLESLRGKYVYIDVWATWCAPCKAEIPHLKKIETAYHDKNIAFVSISVDEQKYSGKWKEFVGNNHLKGIQLIADKAFDSEFIRKMGINAIPRFILIDPSGKIVSADAPRPSDKELITKLNNLL